MKKTAIITLKIIVALLGIGYLLSIPDLHAEVQDTQEVKFQLKIDESLFQIDSVKRVNVSVNTENRKSIHITEVLDDGSERTYQVPLDQEIAETIIMPNDVIFMIGKNGTLIIENLNQDIPGFYLNPDQLAHLIRQNAAIHIVNEDIELTIPVNSFSSEQSFKISLERLAQDSNEVDGLNQSVGSVYRVTIYLDDQIQSVFNYPIMMRFPVDDHEQPDELKIYYRNETTAEWEFVGGEYLEGYIYTHTHHFSIFGLFHPDQIAALSEDEIIDEVEQDSMEENVDETSIIAGENVNLPSTAIHVYNLLMIGLIISIIGVCIYILGINSKQHSKD